MTSADALEQALLLFERYYDINRETPASPFAAEAQFHVHDEQYFLFKSAKYTESDSREIVFFAVSDHLTLDAAKQLDETAWETGLARVEPGPTHRNTDIDLIVFADEVDPDAAEYLRRTRRSKSYKFMLHGWSNYPVIAIETSTGQMTCNRLGQRLKKLFSNINFS